jgi:hypothetical protein
MSEPRAQVNAYADVCIRLEGDVDAPALARLAELDEAPVPPAPLLLAEVEGELWVAVSLATLQAVADPFRPSAEVLALARYRAAQLRDG